MKTFRHLHAAILRAPLYPRGFRPDFSQADSAFRIGLQTASTSFLDALENTAEQKPESKIQRSLLRYQLRATGRCTPFGTFAGITALEATDTEDNRIIMPAAEAHRVHVQIDAERMAELYRVLLKDNPGVLLRPNNSLYRIGRNFRYALQVDAGDGPQYDLSALDGEPYLSQILQHAANGMCFDELTQLIVRIADVPEEEAVGFLTLLLSENILLPDIDPALTGMDPLAELQAKVSMDDNRTIDLGRLGELMQKPGFDQARFAAFSNVLDELLPDRGAGTPDLQLDTYLNCERSSLSQRRLDEITAEFEALLPLAMPYHIPAFEDFKARFAKRYESAAVPLLEALDPDHGIPYGDVATAWVGPLVESLPVTAPAPSAHPTFVRAENTMPVPVPLLNLAKPKPVPVPDTMPAPASPDTMPAPVAPILVPDTMPGPAAPVLVPDTMPGPAAPVRVPDTMPGLSPQDRLHAFNAAKPLPDTMPAPPRPQVPDTMPGPIHVPDTMPGGPVIVPAPDTMPVPSEPVHVPDTMPTPKASGAPVMAPQTTASRSHQQLVQSKYLQSIRDAAQEISLSDEDLHSLQAGPDARFAKTFMLMGSMQHSGGDWRFALDYAGGSTALSLLGRFANGDDALKALTQQIAGIEADSEPDAIVAEIVHQPAPELGNVSRRPVLREFEIPFMSKSGAAPERQIPPGDLMLQMQGGTLCLFRRSTGQRIVPRLSTAHNFSSNVLPVYRFLCELQFQGLSQPAFWDWGSFRDEAFLPAVRYRHLILRRRSWKIPAASLELADFENLRRVRGIPDEVRCGVGDRQLRYDLRNADERALLLTELRANPALRIEDALAEEGPHFVGDEHGNAFANELILPLVNAAHRPVIQQKLRLPDAQVQRVFQPAMGNWHYLRLYCGHAASDEILREGLDDCIKTLFDKSIITRWFFLRYNEGEPELRVRFFLRDASERAVFDAVLARWLQPFMDSGSLTRITVDTYVRELERYGADCIEALESLFAADSQSVAAFLNSTDAAPSESERFVYTICSIDALFSDAGLAVEERIHVLEPLADAFFLEHGGTLLLQQSLNAGYRKNRATIEESLRSYPELFQALLAQRSLEHNRLFSILEAKSGGRPAMLSKLPDLAHMQVNRVFQAGQRRYEMLIYHCLLRHYRSVVARLG